MFVTVGAITFPLDSEISTNLSILGIIMYVLAPVHLFASLTFHASPLYFHVSCVAELFSALNYIGNFLILSA